MIVRELRKHLEDMPENAYIAVASDWQRPDGGQTGMALEELTEVRLTCAVSCEDGHELEERPGGHLRAVVLG